MKGKLFGATLVLTGALIGTLAGGWAWWLTRSAVLAAEPQIKTPPGTLVLDDLLNIDAAGAGAFWAVLTPEAEDRLVEKIRAALAKDVR